MAPRATGGMRPANSRLDAAAPTAFTTFTRLKKSSQLKHCEGLSMPLLDHFHPPLLGHRHWEGFHGRWAAAMSDGLNESLPAEYFAEFQVSLGTRVEVDVATFSEEGAAEASDAGGAALAVQTRLWSPPTPVAVLPAVFPDDFEVLVFNNLAGPTLVGAIELVSPG